MMSACGRQSPRKMLACGRHAVAKEDVGLTAATQSPRLLPQWVPWRVCVPYSLRAGVSEVTYPIAEPTEAGALATA